MLEPGKRSLETADKIHQLATDIHLKQLGAVGNKIRTPEDESFLAKNLKDIPLLGYLPFRDSVIKADMDARPPFDDAPDLVELADKMIEQLLQDKE